MKTDYQKLQEILHNQEIKGIRSQDWKDVRNYETNTEEKNIYLKIPSLFIGFVFNNKTQRFVGMYNWKD